MFDFDPRLGGFAVALGVGLLVGAERERRKGTGPARKPAGIRTFAAAAIAGAVAMALGRGMLVAAVALGFAVLAAAAYRRARDDDPGLTTEVALVLTALLGALAMAEAALAAGLGAGLACLLAARGALHRFVGRVLSEREIEDALTLAAAALVALPLLPDRAFALGWGATFEPRTLGTVVVLVMTASAIAHIARRALGARNGFAVAGFLGGFVSGTATIAAMGVRARSHPAEAGGAVAAAVLSNVATFALAALLLAGVSADALRALAPSLLAGGAVSAVYALAFLPRKVLDEAAKAGDGRAFDLRVAVGLALVLAAAGALASALEMAMGARGLLVGAALAGFADAHAAAVSVAALVAQGRVASEVAAWSILAALTTNAAAKIAASIAGGRAFALRVGVGVVLSLLGAFAALGFIQSGALH
jgi:uncharacterized membrane protein (DUF4010 family)